MSAWRLNEATESCKTVFDRAWGGEPQIIMRDEKPMVVVLSFAAYEAAKPKREPDRVQLVVKKTPVRALKSLVAKPKRALSVEEMNAAIFEGGH